MPYALLQPLTELASAHPDVYVVGGALRDRKLNIPLIDFDFTVRNCAQSSKFFAQILKGTLIALDHTPGRETFRVIGPDQQVFDFSELQGDSIEEDLARRDFTFNAMGQTLSDFLREDQGVIDPYGGISDLEKRIVRSLPGSVLEDDPLRVLRAFRFAASLKFEIDLVTLTRIKKAVPGLLRTAGERIREECELFWKNNNTASFARLMDDAEIWDYIVPERKAQRAILSIAGEKDIVKESLDIYCQLEDFLNDPSSIFPERFSGIESRITQKQITLLKASAILYPLKPVGADEGLLNKALKKLKFSNVDANFIRQALETCLSAQKTGLKFAGWSTDFSAIYEFVDRNENNLIPFLFLIMSSSGTRGLDISPIVLSAHNLTDFYLHRYLPAKQKPPYITGDDLIKQFGMKPSPLFKTILRQIEEGRTLGSIKSKEEAKVMLRAFLDSF